VAIAVIRAVAGEHVVTTADQVRQQAMTGHARVDYGDSLTRAAAEPPNCLEVKPFELTCLGPSGRRGRR
jgi:hypothetical protein